MNRTVLAGVVVLAAAAGGLYVWLQPPPPPQTSVPESAPGETFREAAPPSPQYPVPEPPADADAAVPDAQETEPAPPAAEPAPPPLPELGESDRLASQAVQEIFTVPEPLALFSLDGLIRRLVVTVDNLPRTKLPARRLAVATAPGRFQVSGGEDEFVIKPENHRRYRSHVSLLESLDIETFSRLYIRYYPLFQAAYVELGYPDAYFNDRLVAVIDHLLATPEVREPIRLIRPHVLYQYADPELEALSAGQKALIRMGPDNAARVKAKLREIRARLVRLELE